MPSLQHFFILEFVWTSSVFLTSRPLERKKGEAANEASGVSGHHSQVGVKRSIAETWKASKIPPLSWTFHGLDLKLLSLSV